MLSRFFIDRPVFAWVIAIVIMLAGGIAALSLPVEQYPDIAPPAVSISAFYPGADASTLQNSVTQVIEQQLTGLDHLLYFSSSSNADGSVAITATFSADANPDIAQVQVQNKVQQAIPLLPAAVQQEGIVVAKAQSNFLLVVAVYDDTGRYNNVDIADFITSMMLDPLSRVSGVGQAQVFGSPYAMRIWLDPYKLHNYGLQPSDIRAAVQAQNVQVSAGSIGGQPAVQGQAMNATVTAQSQLQTPDQFRNIIVKTSPAGAVVHLSDVARVELGANSYAITSLFNGHPASGIAIMLAPGANALKTVDAVKTKAMSLRAKPAAGHEDGLSGGQHHLHPPVDPRRDRHPARGDRPGGAGDVHLPAELARHPQSRHRRAGGAAGHLRCAGGGGLFDQHLDPVRAGAGDRPSGR